MAHRVILVVVTALATLAKAEPVSIPAAPMSYHWHWSARPLSGNVVSVDERTAVVDGSGRFAPILTGYFALPDGGRRAVVVTGEHGPTEAIIDRDAKGRVLRIVSVTRRKNATSGRPEPAELVETPKYAADGMLQSISLVPQGESETTVAFKSTKLDGGGWSMQWTQPPDDHNSKGMTAALAFDANNRLVRWDRSLGSSLNPPFEFEYNDKSDVRRALTGATSQDLYEYTYDDQGNWTRCERTIIRNRDKKLTDITTRKITYGELPKVPAEQLVATLGIHRSAVIVEPGGDGKVAPPAAVAAAGQPQLKLPEPKPGADRYRKVMGKPGSKVYVEMIITLNPDKTGSLVTRNEFDGERTTKAALATWELQGNDIAFELTKSLTGEAIPEQVRVMHFGRNKDGDLLMSGDSGAFKKLKDGE